MVKFLFSWLSSLLSQSSVRWCVLCCVWGLGYSRKNPSSWNFYIYHLTSGKKLSPLKILETCVTPLGNSKVKNKDSWKFHTIFSWTPVEIPLLFKWTLEFSYAISSIPLKIPSGISINLGFWMAFEFPRGVAIFCGISRGEAFFSAEFPRVKWQS